MSVLTYNGISLPFPFLSQFEQTAVKDDSGTDFMVQKFELRHQCILNFNYLSTIDPTLVGKMTNPATIVKNIRFRLLQPRKILTYTFNGIDLIPSIPLGNLGSVDARNGPQPQSCIITEATNETFLCTYHIIAHFWENNLIDPAIGVVSNQPGNVVLSNRWSEIADYDNCEYCTRTREGKFVIRSDNTEGWIADQVRTQMSQVAVPKGFLRDSSHYTVDPSGLGITYRIVDKEVFKKPPSPAYEATGEYTETSAMGGAMRTGDVWCRLKGSADTKQDVLVAAAIRLCQAKIIRGLMSNISSVASAPAAAPGVPSNPGFIERTILQLTGIGAAKAAAISAEQKQNIIGSDGRPVSASMKMSLFDNIVECRMSHMFPAQTNVGLNNFNTFTPFSDGTYTPSYSVRGSSKLLLQAAAYYDPSLRNNLAARTDPLTTADDKPYLTTGGTQSPTKAVGRAGKDRE